MLSLTPERGHGSSPANCAYGRIGKSLHDYNFLFTLEQTQVGHALVLRRLCSFFVPHIVFGQHCSSSGGGSPG